jgi:hypothetical protein
MPTMGGHAGLAGVAVQSGGFWFESNPGAFRNSQNGLARSGTLQFENVHANDPLLSHREPRVPGENDPESLSDSAARIILFAVAGAVVGFAIFYVDWPFGAEASPFTATGQYRLWVLIICAQTALWGAASIPIWASIRAYSAHWPGHKREIATAVGLLALLVLGFVIVSALRSGLRLDYPLPHHRWKVGLISVLGSIVALAGAVGVVLVHSALGSVPTRGRSGADQIGDFLRIRADLHRLLTIEGAILGAAILSTGALRNAILAYGHDANRTYSFPPEYVLLYGAYFSAVLALLYAPTYSRLLSVGGQLRDSFFPLQSPRMETWSDWYDKRKRLEELLKLEVTAGESFRTGVAILTPLASGLVGLLLHAK